MCKIKIFLGFSYISYGLIKLNHKSTPPIKNMVNFVFRGKNVISSIHVNQGYFGILVGLEFSIRSVSRFSLP